MRSRLEGGRACIEQHQQYQDRCDSIMADSRATPAFPARCRPPEAACGHDGCFALDSRSWDAPLRFEGSKSKAPSLIHW